MTPWSMFLRDIRPQLPMCPQVVIRGVVRNVSQDFCEASLTWQDTIDDIYVDCRNRDIVVDTPEDGVVIQFEYLGMPHPPGFPLDPLVPFDSFQYAETDPGLEPRSERWLDDNMHGWRDIPGTPRYYTRPTRDVLWLAPRPPTDMRLKAKVSLKPADTALGVPDDMYRDFRAVIQDGTLASLLMIPNKKWTNAANSQFYSRRFYDGCATALTRQSRSNTKAPIRTKTNIRF